MDVSLDDYISKSNIRVQIGNAKGPTKITGLQTGRKPVAKFQTQPLTDVSITVPGVKKQAGFQVNKTNQVRDARDKLTAKNKPSDAREKLNQKAQSSDARQKLLTLRAKKGLGTVAGAGGGPVDARVMLQAKRQQKGAAVQSTGGGGFNITRTVGNAAGNAPVGASGVQITRTLSRVMPPGYEDLTAPKFKPIVIQQTGGPPQQITRTVNQSPKNIIRTVPGNLPNYPPPPQQPQQIYPPPPAQAPYPPGPVVYAGQPPPPQQVYYDRPPPVASQPYPFPPPQQPIQQPPPVPAPAPHVQYIPSPVAQYPPPPFVSPPPQNLTPPKGGPPYPVEDTVTITRTVGQQIGQPATPQPEIPIIQVRNDQYQPPQPHTMYPPREPQYPREAPYPRVEPSESVLYSESPAQPVLQRTVPNTSNSAFTKSVANDTAQISVQQSSVKRKVPVGGPLKLSNTNTVPVIEAPVGRSSESTTKYSRVTVDEPPMKKTKEEVPAELEDGISPLQGYKIVVTNLHPSVSQDDIIELFGAVGAVKRVKLVKPGLADVVYVKSEDAVTATKTYHNRELDGLPMIVKMVTPASAKVVEAPEKLPANVKPAASGPLKLSKKPAGMAKVSEKKSVDVGTLHKALFKIGSSVSTKPVTFTVNI